MDMSEWNPFGEDNFSSYTEDIIFGKEFDKIRRGSNSSISNVKSREDLVMSGSDSSDPFSNAPFKRPDDVIPKSPRRHSTGSADVALEHTKDLIDFNSETGGKSHDIFGGNSLIKVALGLASKKYKQLVDTDEGKEKKRPESKGKKLGSKPAVVRPKELVDSSSEDYQGGIINQAAADFNYQELDDEYGSRPSAVKPTKHKEGFESIEEYDANKSIRNFSSDHSLSHYEAPESQGDRIVGHEYGVKPLLDDDELEDTYTNVGASHSSSSSSLRPKRQSMTQENTGCEAGLLNSPFDEDIFAAAPFPVRSNTKRRPISAIITSSTSAASYLPEDVFAKAPFRSKLSTRLQSVSKRKQTSTSTHSLSSSHTPPIVNDDVFSKAPFSGKKTPSSVPTAPSSCAVTPDLEPPQPVPISEPSRTITPEREFCSSPSRASSVPSSAGSQDVFGSVPFPDMPSAYSGTLHQNPSSSEDDINLSPSLDDQQSEDSFLLAPCDVEAIAEGPNHTCAESPSSEDEAFRQMAESSAARTSTQAATSAKHSKSSKSKFRRGLRDISSSAFSNMSYFDDDELEHDDDRMHPESAVASPQVTSVVTL